MSSSSSASRSATTSATASAHAAKGRSVVRRSNSNGGGRTALPSKAELIVRFLVLTVGGWFFTKALFHIHATYFAAGYSTGSYWVTSTPSIKGDLGGIGLVLVWLAFVDVIFAMHTLARWWLLHALANAVVVVISFPDLIEAMRDPFNGCTTVKATSHVLPFYFIAATHSYHLLAFRNLPMGDWVHHIVFGGSICCMCLFFSPVGPIQNVVGFFLSGLPGGLDYVMLCLEKHGMLSRMTEKKWNARINVWLRSPGCVLTAMLLWTATVAPNTSRCSVIPAVPLFTALLCVVNGQYYMQVVVQNTSRKDEKYSC